VFRSRERRDLAEEIALKKAASRVEVHPNGEVPDWNPTSPTGAPTSGKMASFGQAFATLVMLSMSRTSELPLTPDEMAASPILFTPSGTGIPGAQAGGCASCSLRDIFAVGTCPPSNEGENVSHACAGSQQDHHRKLFGEGGSSRDRSVNPRSRVPASHQRRTKGLREQRTVLREIWPNEGLNHIAEILGQQSRSGFGPRGAKVPRPAKPRRARTNRKPRPP
jgi:hypothetical protein